MWSYRQDPLKMQRLLRLAECVNAKCPWSGKAVRADSLTMFEGAVVGFCNPGCRDKFDPRVHSEAVAFFRNAQRTQGLGFKSV